MNVQLTPAETSLLVTIPDIKTVAAGPFLLGFRARGTTSLVLANLWFLRGHSPSLLLAAAIASPVSDT